MKDVQVALRSKGEEAKSCAIEVSIITLITFYSVY